MCNTKLNHIITQKVKVEVTEVSVTINCLKMPLKLKKKKIFFFSALDDFV